MRKTMICLLTTLMTALCCSGSVWSDGERFHKGAWGISIDAVKALERNSVLWGEDIVADGLNVSVALFYHVGFMGRTIRTDYFFKNDRLFGISMGCIDEGFQNLSHAQAAHLHAQMETALINELGPARYCTLERYLSPYAEHAYWRIMFITDGKTLAILSSTYFIQEERLMFSYNADNAFDPENLGTMEIFDDLKAAGRLRDTTKGLKLPENESWLYE